MATRFGAVSPAQTYATKVRWLVGCLVSVIVVLAIGIVIIAQNTTATETAPAAVPEAPQVQQAAPAMDVLVAASRIEEGARLQPNMFTQVSMEADKAPMAVVRKQDADKIMGKFAKRMINSNMPIVLDDVSDTVPLSSLQIPPGYRAATITVDARSGVEGFAKPNSRVDVLWSYNQEGKKKVATIARFVKVLSVGGTTATESQKVAVNNKGTTVTMLVTEKDAKKIELARTLGDLSLSLVGEQETSNKSNEPDTVTIQDLIGKPASADAPEVNNDGVMYTADPRSGRQLRYTLRNGRWTLDRSYNGSEE